MSDSFFSKYIWKSNEKEGDGGLDKIPPPDFGSSSPAPVFNPATPPANHNPTVHTISVGQTAIPTQTPEELLKYREHIKSVMRNANQQGPDYFEFSEAMERNAPLNLERTVSFAVAYNSLVGSGLTKQRLVDSANFYIGKLKEDLASFKQDRETRRIKEVQGRDTEMSRLAEENQKKQEQIKKLSEEINAHNARIQQLSVEKTTAEQKIAASTANMETAITQEISHIEADVQTIQKVIQ